MTPPAFHVAPEAVQAAHDVAERVRAFAARRGAESSATARLHAWLRFAPAYHCNALEDDGLTETETKAVLVDGVTVGKSLRAHLWAVNVAAAVARVEAWAADAAPIGEAHILALGAILLRGIDEPNAGVYRRLAVYLTDEDDFEPPPPDEVPARMQALIAWLAGPHGDGDGEPIVEAARLGAWFATIHPFVEGNGRACRLLMDLWLQRHGLIRALIRDESRARYRRAITQARAGELSALVLLLSESVGMMLAEQERASQPR